MFVRRAHRGWHLATMAFVCALAAANLHAAEKPQDAAVAEADVAATAQAAHPNVLVIICDDLNDTIDGMGGHPQARTPNIDRLSRSGVRFLAAYSADPVCGPSRGSLWSGLYPHTTGLYGYNQNNYTWRDSPVLKNAVTVFEHFAARGYQTYATGKIFHNNHHTVPLFGQEHFGAPASFGPFPWDGKARHGFNVRHPSMKLPWGENGFETFAPLSDVPHVAADPKRGTPGFDGWYDRGRAFRYRSDEDRDLMVDELSVEFARKVLGQRHDQPFFLTVGFLRPHCPWIAPKKYFDQFPLESIQFPPYRPNDLDDCGSFIPQMKQQISWYTRFERLREAYGDDEGWKRWIQGYLACVAFVDDQVGGLLDALQQSPYRDNTVVLFTSDHGFHMGEKDLLIKKTCWEEATRVPLIVRAPGGRQGADCPVPVSLVDVYPTLVDLCGLPREPNRHTNGVQLDGQSLRPLLEQPSGETWPGPHAALSVIEGNEPVGIGAIAPKGRQNFTLRTHDWRYIRYKDGEEELYDHRTDPQEWTNLAAQPEYEPIKRILRQQLFERTGMTE